MRLKEWHCWAILIFLSSLAIALPLIRDYSSFRSLFNVSPSVALSDQDRREWCFSSISTLPSGASYVAGVNFRLIASDRVREYDPSATVLLEGLRVELKQELRDTRIRFPEPVLPWVRSPNECLYGFGSSYTVPDFSSAVLFCPNEEARAKWQGWIDAKMTQARPYLSNLPLPPLIFPPEEKK